MQAAFGRAQGRAAVQPETRETGGGLLSDLHAARANADRQAFVFQRMLHEEGVQWLCIGYNEDGHC